MQNKRVIVIGLDGATWDLLESWAIQGQLPNLNKLMKNGCYGSLESTIPHITPPAWTSMTTGKNPGKHGIFDFISIIKENKSVQNLNLYNSRSKKSKEIWDYLNMKSIVVNVPVTYPPRKINGVMVTGMYTPHMGSDFTYPMELKREILELFPNYKIELNLNEYTDNKQNFLGDLYKLTEERIKLFWHFFRKDWNFYFFVFVGTDRIQHIYWDEGELLNYYQYLDNFLGEVIINIKKENINLLLVSDHGFAKIKKVAYINAFLQKEGYLKLKVEKKSGNFLGNFGVNKEKILEILLKNRFYKLIEFYGKLPSGILHLIRKTVPGKSNPVYDFDLKKSKAVMVGSGSVYILEENPSKKNVIENEIIRKLENIKNPDKRERIIEKVFKKEEIYSGNLISKAPDLLILPKNGYSLAQSVSENILEEPKWKKADHSLQGIFLSYGPDIKKNVKLKAKIYDIAPTILHMFDVSIPTDVDGRVLKEIFDDESDISKRKQKFVIPSYYDKREEDETIKNVIKNLKLKGKI